MTTTTVNELAAAKRSVDACEDDLMASQNSWEDLVALLDVRFAERRGSKSDPLLDALTAIPLASANAGADEPLLAACAAVLSRFRKMKHLDLESATTFDWQSAAKTLDGREASSAELLAWGSVLPFLCHTLGEQMWWSVLGELKAAHQRSLEDSQPGSETGLLLATELGLTLAWGLMPLRSTKRLVDTSWDAFERYLQAEDDRLRDALSSCGGKLSNHLASALRSLEVAQRGFRKKLRRSMLAEINEMAQWLIHLTRWDGSFIGAREDSDAKQRLRRTKAIIDAVAEATHDAGLRTGLQFALRRGDKAPEHRLRTETDLPESGFYSPQAGLVSLRPTWFKHHGWFVGAFQGTAAPDIELSTGKRLILQGLWETEIIADGRECRPESDWEQVCWHGDDEVHYIEMQQTWTGDITLQRSVLVLRDDGVVLLADTLLCDDDVEFQYRSSVPVDPGMTTEEEAETREILFRDRKSRAMVLPIGMPEWRTARFPGKLSVSDGRLTLSMRGTRQLYAPIWFDFEPHRFDRPRTWRGLTVASRLEIAKPHQAVASRIQFGSEQWIVFRAMDSHNAWTFCGKHLAADFFCGHFDPEDGTMDELITVDSPGESS
ncbi:MAG: hypothetical protein R3C05_01570 [Pirellulaceae bacterium]